MPARFPVMPARFPVMPARFLVMPARFPVMPAPFLVIPANAGISPRPQWLVRTLLVWGFRELRWSSSETWSPGGRDHTHNRLVDVDGGSSFLKTSRPCQRDCPCHDGSCVGVGCREGSCVWVGCREGSYVRVGCHEGASQCAARSWEPSPLRSPARQGRSEPELRQRPRAEVGGGGGGPDPSRGWVWPPRELATEAGWLGSGPPPPPTSSLDSHGRWSRRNRPAASGKLDRQRSRRGGAYPRAARTRPAAVLPSPRPAMRGVTAFITKPICRMVGFSPREAVTAATSSSTIAAISASLSCWGR